MKFMTVLTEFSSPFIEERLYLIEIKKMGEKIKKVLVPFYRGAVVFVSASSGKHNKLNVLVPFYRGAVVFREL